jgi:hypothetical protein
MKTLKISEAVHSKLTSILGTLMAETGRPATYSEALKTLLNKSVMLSPGLFRQIETYVREHPEMGYVTEREFIEDAIRSKLSGSSES